MPTVREQILDKAWAILEGDGAVLAFFPRAANRNRADKPGWLRGFFAASPNDFPRISIDLIRGRHSMYTLEKSFGQEDPNFHLGTTDWEVDRNFDMAITVRSPADPSGEVNAPEELILQAILKAGTRFGLNPLVMNLGEASFERRDTRKDEKPSPGYVTTIRLPITTRESGIALRNA